MNKTLRIAAVALMTLAAVPALAQSTQGGRGGEGGGHGGGGGANGAGSRIDRMVIYPCTAGPQCERPRRALMVNPDTCGQQVRHGTDAMYFYHRCDVRL